MKTTTKKELAPGCARTHSSAEECLAAKVTQYWIRWADNHGFEYEVQERIYYNLPDNRVLESMDQDATRSPESWYELRVFVDHETPRAHYEDVSRVLRDRNPETPEELDAAIAEAEAMTRDRIAWRAEKDARDEARLLWLLDNLSSVLPRRIMTGSKMLDDLWNCGGDARELSKFCRDQKISKSDLAEKISDSQK